MSFITLNQVDILQNKNLVLQNINLTIEKGEFVYLVGKTGSGKSTLLKAMYADVLVNNGKLSVLGQSLLNIKKRKILSLRRKLGIIFQDFQLLSDRSVRDNLKFVMKATGWRGKKKIDNEINTLLSKVKMLEKADQFPHQLSGGEQQMRLLEHWLITQS